VWNIWKDVKLLLDDFGLLLNLFDFTWFAVRFSSLLAGFVSFTQQGDVAYNQGPRPTKLPDQLCVPAPIFHCLWRPAKPSTGMSFSNFFQTKQLYGFRNLTELHQNHKSFEQGRRKISFAQFLTSNHSLFPVRFNWSVFARAMHSTLVINSIRYFWASVCV